ncbi:protein kinase domain [Coleofasciculus chthonoplastes PCC 7420]|uniref:Protein kinase domain n=1 Tax=Coleofasciculus chthonoplastes PCC 7420 TaxID=118168 RepID=B4VUA6_9CYAN|nr:serine/threonine-protein kinase [Coleofasciculus chthonoplastes]EDX74482.1 protein kinase domain [Coleofasciculus chthonoplastes PCC 7420]
MSYCLNLTCPKPDNPDHARFCSTCGSKLLLGDRYRAMELISQGGIGRTFRAIDESESGLSTCIIKQFSPTNQGTTNIEKAAASFRQEAARLQTLGEHPQIPRLLAYFEPNPQRGTTGAIVQCLVEGESLAQQLVQEGAFNETQIRHILAQLLPVLQYIHSHQVIHRDINPANIICSASTGIETDADTLVLVDFSAAKLTTKTALARTGTVIGSAAYAAPEQLMGKAVTSSDLYSLGVTCIHLLTSIHPFDLFNSLEGMWVWQDYLVEPISDRLTQTLNKMLEGAVKLRYQSAAQILQDLHLTQTLAQSLSVASPNPSVKPNTLTPTWQCVRTLRGHSSSIHAIAFHPDGQILASGGADRSVKLWHLESGIPSCTFSGHSSLIDTIAFSPDGQFLVSGSWDHTIKLWELTTQTLKHTLKQHSGWIKSVAFSSDGQLLASGSADKTINIWNLNLQDIQKTLDGHSSMIHTIVISPDGQILASGSADRTIKLWNLATGEIQLTLHGHTDAVNSLAFSPSGQLLISGSADATIQVWNLKTGDILLTLTEHTDAVHSVAISAKGRLLISGSADGTVRLWHPGRGKLIQTLSDHSAGVMSVAISPDSSTLASAAQDKTIKLWQFI